jgi:hypothetical protein
MRILGKLDLPEKEGGNTSNLILPSGTSFPLVATTGELFYLSQSGSGYTKGLHVYDGSDWISYSLNSSVVGYQPMHGHPDSTQTSLSYNQATRTITISPTGSSFDIWIKGTKFTYTEAISKQHANTTGEHYLYIDHAGQAQIGTTFWNLYIDIPCCWVYYNAAVGKGIALNERHGAWRDPANHIRQHLVEGTQVKPGGFSANSYTLNNSSSNASITFGISSGDVIDEDLITSVGQLTAGGPYTILTRIGSAGDWQWTTNNTIPFLVGTTFVKANTYVSSAWQTTELTSKKYLNYYVFATPAIDSLFGIILVPGQAIYTTLATAQAESVSSLLWGGIPFAEISPVYKITIQVDNAWNTITGRVRIIEFNRLSGSKASLSIGASATVHNALSGRSEADSHPATAITVTPSGNLVSTEVQAALVELDTEKSATGHDHATSISGSAAKLTTSRTVALTGDVTATGSFDGSANLSLTATGVQAAKLTTSRTISLTGDVTATGSFDGSANLSLATTVISAPKLTTARSISLTGDVTATGSFDGSANLSLTATGVSAAKLTTARAIALSGDVTGTANFDGSAGISITTTGVKAAKLTTARSIALSGDVTGTANFDGSAGISITTTGVQAAKLTTIRSISLTGDVTATGNFDGSANLSLTATGVQAAKLTTPRAIALSGDVTGTANFDGSAGISITTTVASFTHTHSTYVLATSGTATDLILAKSKIRQATDQSAGTGTVTFNYDNGDYLKITAAGNITIALSNLPTGYVCSITLQCVNFGAYTITWPSGIKWSSGAAPALTSSGTDFICITKDKNEAIYGFLLARDIR